VSKRFRVAAAFSLVVAAAIATALLLGATSSTPLAREGSEHQGLAFARHTQELLNRGSKDGPASYADQVEQLNAYPAAAVTSANVATARSAFTAISGRSLPRGHSLTSWYNLGPTRAIFPAFLNRHDYITSGRITALAISPTTCNASDCTVWVGAAGGGVWKSDHALSQNPNWVNVSDGYFKSGAVGSLTYDWAHNTLYAGTGELAAAGDAEAGVGIYKSTDGGATWTALPGNAAFDLRAIRDIKVDPADPTGRTLFAASGRGVRGISATTAGSLSIPPVGPAYGLLRSKDGGATWEVLEPSSAGNITDGLANSFATRRGVTDVAIDPSDPHTVYASAYGKGVWRSNQDGDTGTWTQIKPAQAGGGTADRTEFALARMSPTGRTSHTRMYVTEGDSGPATTNPSRFWIADDVQSGTPTFVLKTSSNPADPGYATFDFCTGQCWYDQGVYSPPGQPNMVYIYGSYNYGEAPDASFHNPGGISNARAVLLSRDGGNTFTDLTDDATSPTAPNGLHPDQHALITNPGNPLQIFEGSDGGLMISDGTLADTSSRCDARNLSGAVLARCKQLLSAVPGKWTSANAGLQTLQFQSLSVNPANSKNIQGGTQDNGTFETQGSNIIWPQTIFGDGGLSGFDATDKHFRFHTYFSQQVDVSFQDGAPPSWDWIADPLFAESSLFYFPIITDPTVHGTMFAGLNHVWRTLDNGGSQAYLDSNCNEFTGTFTSGTTCGDWVPLDGLSLTGTGRGALRAGGNVSWLQRTASDASTLWAATTTGRVFVSHNANAASPGAVTFTQLDSLAANSPGRAVSSIYVDPANSNHAWVSYLGYNGNTPAQPGHVFSVTYDPNAGTATWTSVDGTGAGSIGDQPVNAIVYDKGTGDLYAATDFGVVKLLASDTGSGWVLAADNLPVVTVAGLTINPGARQLLAATHGRGAYQLSLP
jgi:hypothetical protein